MRGNRGEALAVTGVAEALADALMAQAAVPASQPRDAPHIAVAAANGVQYPATWNFEHIADPTPQDRIAAVCRRGRFEPPVIGTPGQLPEASRGPDADRRGPCDPPRAGGGCRQRHPPHRRGGPAAAAGVGGVYLSLPSRAPQRENGPTPPLPRSGAA